MKTNDYDISDESQHDSAAYDIKQSAQRELATGGHQLLAQDLRPLGPFRRQL